MITSAQVLSESDASTNAKPVGERPIVPFDAKLRRPGGRLGSSDSRTGHGVSRGRASENTALRPLPGTDLVRQQLTVALQHSHFFVITVNDQGQVQFQTGAVGELLTTKVISGRSLFGSHLAKSVPEFVRRMKKALRERNEDHFEWFNPACQRWIAQHIYPEGSGITTFGFDLREQGGLQEAGGRQQEQLVYQTSDDLVTGLLNRRSFQLIVERGCRGQFGGRFSLLLIDVDGFKTANDALGHLAGDCLLIQVADRLRACVGRSDILGRLGDDEFAVLHCDGRAPARPRRLVNTIIEAMRQPFLVEGTKVHLTVSVGVSVFPEDGHGHDRLLTAADIAMNRVKQDGGNGWQTFQEGMQIEVDTRRAVREGLLEAVGNGQTAMHYQPMIDLRRGLVTGFEALLRWNHPSQGLVLPSQFLQVAEEDGTIVPLGEWTILTACREAASWRSNCAVGINLSARQFRSNIVGAVSHALGETQIDPSRVIVEVSDAVLAGQTERNVDALHRLQGLGVKILLDGFGSGFAPYQALRLFPFDKIKIDRCLIRELSLSRDAQVIVRSIAALARDLGIEVVAQGVETAEELRYLRECGCHQAQGFFFCKPMTFERTLHYLKSCAAGQTGFETPADSAEV